MHKIYKILERFSFAVYNFQTGKIVLLGKTLFNNVNLGHNIESSFYKSKKFDTIQCEIYRSIKDSNIFSHIHGFKLV